MHAQTTMIENGFVHVPDAAPWLAPYLHELTIFPHGKHADQVPLGHFVPGATTQLLDWYKQGGGPNSGIFELYRQLAEESRGRQAVRDRRVRLRVPAGIGRMNTLHLAVAADCDVGERGRVIRAGGVGAGRCRRPGRNAKQRFDLMNGVEPRRNRAAGLANCCYRLVVARSPAEPASADRMESEGPPRALDALDALSSQCRQPAELSRVLSSWNDRPNLVRRSLSSAVIRSALSTGLCATLIA